MGLRDERARRRRAAELERRLAELDELDRRYGLGTLPSAVPPPPRRRHRRGWLLVPVAVAAVVWWWPGEQPQDGWSTTGGAPVIDRIQTPQQAAPSRWRPATGDRVLPPVDPGAADAHTFLGAQADGTPVGFSPCGRVEVEVNPDGAPPEHQDHLSGALASLSRAAGLQLDLVGTSTDTWSDERAPGDPVLVGWATPAQVPDLAGGIAGLGGPLVATMPDGRSWHAGGRVVINAEGSRTPAEERLVLEHELAHVLGLGHVGDPGELMAPLLSGQSGLGAGDLAGLARLGGVACP